MIILVEYVRARGSRSSRVDGIRGVKCVAVLPGLGVNGRVSLFVAERYAPGKSSVGRHAGARRAYGCGVNSVAA